MSYKKLDLPSVWGQGQHSKQHQAQDLVANIRTEPVPIVTQKEARFQNYVLQLEL